MSSRVIFYISPVLSTRFLLVLGECEYSFGEVNYPVQGIIEDLWLLVLIHSV